MSSIASLQLSEFITLTPVFPCLIWVEINKGNYLNLNKTQLNSAFLYINHIHLCKLFNKIVYLSKYHLLSSKLMLKLLVIFIL